MEEQDTVSKGGRSLGPERGKRYSYVHLELVWPSGKALGWSAEEPRFEPLRLSFLFKIAVYGHSLATLPTQLTKTINMAHTAAHLDA